MKAEYISASAIEKILPELPTYYGGFVDGELVMIGSDRPQYEQAKASFENRLRRIGRDK